MKLVKTKELPEVGVSHNAEIKKKVYIERGEIPQLMMFGSAVFKPGQKVELHKHDTMFEVFQIVNGKAQFIVNNKTIILSEGDCITIEPGELHAQSNPFKVDVHWNYFGIATD
ncbi:Cupin domain-containing protein [Maribacter vaceletii]|uniref:Cupin domain-containing protein n=1 Tax=Maribacter vaceletii TaxID=1206816 RepID=A0A495ECT3_9FLAO|nr:cupin domain-containing protein [Maribacter vaceletii]RKR14698.1 Cupin domain-containing protein [Maribacter vaceletii]